MLNQGETPKKPTEKQAMALKVGRAMKVEVVVKARKTSSPRRSRR
jgi:hypothetical protein